jgi:AAHS family 4-hydroxybenzoate transporter-like MFS transporter
MMAAGGEVQKRGRKEPLSAMQLRVLFLVLLLYTIDGADMQILGVTVAALSHDWGVPLAGFGAAMAAGHAGSAIGASVGGILGDRFGRRPIIISGTIFFGFFSLAMVLATTPTHAMILRFIAGLGMGGCLPPALALLTECLPAGRRSLAVSLAILCAPLGISIAGFLGATVLPVHGWQVMFVIAGLAPFVLGMLFYVTLPESPSYLARRPERGSELGRLLARLGSAELRDAVIESKMGERGSAGGLFTPARRFGFLLLLAVFFFSFGSMSIVLSWLPALLTKVGFSVQIASTALSWWSLAGIAGVLVAGLLMSHFGARLIVLVYMAGSIAVLGLVAITLPHPGETAALLLFYGLIAAGGFALNGTMTTIYAYAAVNLAPEVRATGIGLAATCGRLGGIAGALAGAALLNFSGANGFFALTAAVIGIALLLFASMLWAGGLQRTKSVSAIKT